MKLRPLLVIIYNVICLRKFYDEVIDTLGIFQQPGQQKNIDFCVIIHYAGCVTLVQDTRKKLQEVCLFFFSQQFFSLR